MTDKHTPGPWNVSPTDSRIVQGEGRGIATAHSHTTQPAVEGDANARLIAAAPTLLEAMKTLMPWMGKALADGVFAGCALPLAANKAVDQATAAIKAAKGNA